MRRGHVLAMLVLSVSTSPPSALADDTIVVEAYVGERPADASRLVGPLLAELSLAGYITGVGARERVEVAVSRAGSAADAMGADEMRKVAEEGWSAWIRGDFARAVEKCGRVAAEVSRIPAIIAADASVRTAVQQALVGLALGHKRLGHASEAREAMAEVVRSFPDREFSRSLFGTEALELYQRVKRELDGEGRGTLHVAVDDERVIIFVNERYASAGKLDATDLLPGQYRVYMQQGRKHGRLHVVNVKSHADAHLNVSWAMDSVLHSSNDWTGFLFEGASERSKLEWLLVSNVARAVEARAVVVVGVTTIGGQRSLVGTVYNADAGRPQRSGSISAEADPARMNDAVRNLSRFLAGQPAAPGVMVLDGMARADDGAAESRASSRSAWPWIAMGGAAAAVTSGVYLLTIHHDGTDCGDPSTPCRRRYNTLALGTAATAAGVGLGALGVYLLLRHPRRALVPDVAAISSTRGGASIVVGWDF